MEKSKDFGYIKFHSSIIRMAIERCRSLFPGIGQNAVLRVSLGEVTWDFDSIDEFLTAHAHQSVDRVHLQMYWREMHDGFTVQFTHKTIISVRSNSRAAIEAIFSVFEEAGKDCWVETYPDQEISIFIGHGGDPQWEKLKNHLQDKHKLDVVAYETGARAGHTIRDILEDMSQRASFALLVLTGEDRTESGMRARQNVIHECGLFQGRLGFDKAILLVENGVELASNFDGIQQLRFDRGRISEVFGDIIAVLRREFGRP